MISPQTIREKTFEKAVFGGYDMAEVDGFLIEASEELSKAQKETVDIKRKMKVLVEKIEEYRSNEDALRMALVSAQKMSVHIQSEAEQRCAELLEAAQTESSAILDSIKGEVKAEEELLVKAKRESAEFIERMRLVCSRQMDFYDALVEAEPDFAAAAVTRSEPEHVAAPVLAQESELEEDTIRSIEDSVAKLVEEPQELNLSSELGGQAYDPLDIDGETKKFSFATTGDADASQTKISFDDLRFGEDYRS